jgi:hypothetical protein
MHEPETQAEGLSHISRGQSGAAPSESRIFKYSGALEGHSIAECGIRIAECSECQMHESAIQAEGLSHISRGQSGASPSESRIIKYSGALEGRSSAEFGMRNAE